MMLWTDAYLADTTHLRVEEHGAYLLLLMAAWRAKDGALADNDQFLARVCRCTPERWRSKFRPVMEPFFTIAGGLWTQKRLLKEREHLKNIRAKRVAAAHAKHLKDKETTPAHAGANGVQSTTTSTTTQDKKESPNGLSTPSPPAKADRKAVGYSLEFEKLWLAYPRRDEDDKAGCWKLYRSATADHDAAALQAAALEWHREQRDNEFRIGLRRWLKDRRYLTPPPIHRPNGSPKADPFFAAAHDLLNPQDRTHDQDDFGAVLEGTCDREPHEASGGGPLVDPLGGGSASLAGGLRRRVAALPAARGDGWLRAVGPPEGDVARLGRADQLH
jgi:uncharacterized protein YdaU (DUF1376 family)